MVVRHMISAPSIFYPSTLLLKKIETKCEKLKLLTGFILQPNLLGYYSLIVLYSPRRFQ